MHDHPERWQRVKQVFQGALDRDPAERRAFVREACGGDGELRSRVEALLAADQATHDPLATPVGELAVRLLAGAREDLPAGSRVGPYRLLREIGRGGMGTIYLAARDDGQYRDQVAVKLIKRGLDSDAIIARFRRERQILAGLKHPHIARLLDGGVAPDGRPYFVMEHIEGLSIERYCDDRGLETRARLELFRAVCAAVHAAHRSLVVHCDLKPGNILVTPDGAPKLLDFGIARLLDPAGDAPAGTLTAAARPLTPEYASPEQVSGRPLTTASDVYSLGVVLYELLTGSPPFRLAELGRQGVEDAVCDREPEKPSTAVRRAPPDGGTRRSRRLAGDLDNIVLKALAKEPERRYGSAEQLAEDLTRHLDGLPVLARKPTTAYRAGKFLRRHRAGVAAALLVVLSLVAGIVATAHQARVAQERELTAKRTLDFLIELFQGSDPELVGEPPTLRELLDEGAERITRELRDEPLPRARLMDALGEIYRRLGLYEPAEPLLAESLAIRRELLGPDHEEIADSLHHLGSLRFWQSDYARAGALLEEALAMRRRLFDDRHPAVAESLHRLGFLRKSEGRFEEAEALYREALAIRRELPDAPLENVLTLNNLGVVLLSRGRYDEAESHLREALAMGRAELGEEHPRVAMVLNNLALVARRRGDDQAAVELYRQALAIQRSRLGSHPEVAAILSNLGFVLSGLGSHDQAEAHHREALAMVIERLGDRHVYVANAQKSLALALLDKGLHKEAEDLLRGALEIHREQLGEWHPRVAIDLQSLARVAWVRGDDRATEDLLKQTLEIQVRSLGDRHPEVAITLTSIGRVLQKRGECDDAEEFFRQSLAIQLEAGGDTDQLVQTRRRLAICLSALGRFEDAESLLLENHEAAVMEDGSQAAELRQELVALYDAWKKPAEAARWRR